MEVSTVREDCRSSWEWNVQHYSRMQKLGIRVLREVDVLRDVALGQLQHMRIILFPKGW
jgi:hypothetical protein